MLAMGVASPAGKPLTAGACLCTPFAHAIHTLTGVLGSCSQERGIGSCWPFVDKGMGWRVTGCLLWLESRWIAACLAMQLLVRRESGSRDLDLGLHHGRAASHAVVEAGVCVAPEPQGLIEGGPSVSGMRVACTKVGPVAVNGCYSCLTVAIFSFAFWTYSRYVPTGAAPAT